LAKLRAANGPGLFDAMALAREACEKRDRNADLALGLERLGPGSALARALTDRGDLGAPFRFEREVAPVLTRLCVGANSSLAPW
jgi:hypothetical protein